MNQVIFPDELGQLATAKSGTIYAELAQFGLIRFAGGDAQSFLHGQLSCDVANLQPWHAQYGSYSTPQGRMLASFLLWRDEHGYVMQLPRDLCESIRRRLSMYVLRAKVKATDVSGEYTLIGIAGLNAETALVPWFQNLGAAPLLAMTTAQDVNLLRLAPQRFEIIAASARARELRDMIARAATPVASAVWDWFDIMAGIPYITPATQEQFVPQMANLDLIGGVSFTKGCYPGQEIVARMHYLGRLKQRMYLANIAVDASPSPGDKLYSAEFGEQACGMIMNATRAPDGGSDVLAVIRIESAGSANVHLRSAEGPRLRFLDLPYKI